MSLVGSGEFEPWAEAADRCLLDRARKGDGRVLILPTASAPDGDAVFEEWCEKGLEHFGRLGIKAEAVRLRTRVDANDPALIARLRRASMVYFSGGNPAYLAKTLAGTDFWRSLRSAMQRGLGYAGCSAGAACLSPTTPDSSVEGLIPELLKPGLNVFPSISIAPHWDALESFLPGLTDFFIASVPAGRTLLGIDETTAIVGDGVDWTVYGKGAAHLRENDIWRHFPDRSSFSLNVFRRL